MANLTVSQTLLDADLFGLPSTNDAFDFSRRVFEEGSTLLLSSEPENTPTTDNTIRREWTNPVFTGQFETYTFTGKLTHSISNADVTGRSWNFTRLLVESAGFGSATFSIASTATLSSTSIMSNFSSTKAQFVGEDGSGWTLEGTLTASFSVSNPDGTFKEEYRALTLNDGGNSLKFTGKIVFDLEGVATGSITGIAANLGGVTTSATGLSLSANELLSIDFSSGFAAIAPILLSHNDTITVSSTSVPGTSIEGFGGNDTITGSSSDDLIDGGAGNDSINAGQGDDFIIAGLGDVIDGGAGNDTVDLDSILDADDEPIAYDLFLRSTNDGADRPYSVTGTTSALVFTDPSTNQTIKLNNVEQFILNGEEISAGKFLNPNLREITADDVIFGFESMGGSLKGLDLQLFDIDVSGNYRPFVLEENLILLYSSGFDTRSFSYDTSSLSNVTFTWASLETASGVAPSTLEFAHSGSASGATLRWTVKNETETLLVTDRPTGEADTYAYTNKAGSLNIDDDVSLTVSVTETSEVSSTLSTDYVIDYAGPAGATLGVTGSQIRFFSGPTDFIEVESHVIEINRFNVVDSAGTSGMFAGTLDFDVATGVTEFEFTDGAFSDDFVSSEFSEVTGSVDAEIVSSFEDLLSSPDGTVSGSVFNVPQNLFNEGDQIWKILRPTIENGLAVVEGGRGADTMTGSSGDDELWGGGNGYYFYEVLTSDFPTDDLTGDVIDAGRGDDIVYGGWSDTLDGGAGNDTLDLDLADIVAEASITNIIGTGLSDFEIQGQSNNGDSLTIKAMGFEVLIVGGVEYIGASALSELRAAFL